MSSTQVGSARAAAGVPDFKVDGSAASFPIISKFFQQLFWAPMRLIVLGTAMNSGLLDALKDGPLSSQEVADRLGTNPRATRMILNELCGLEVLEKKDGRYSLSQEGRMFFTSDSLLSLRSSFRHGEMLAQPWHGLGSVLKTGEPQQQVDREERGPEFFKELVRTIFPFSYSAATALVGRLRLPSSSAMRILDVAGGSGAWSLPFAQKYAQASVDVADFPAVLEVARDYAEKLGVANRYSYIAGNIQELDFGEKRYDLIILGHICHSLGAHWSDAVIAKCGRALKRGGTLVIADWVADDERSSSEFPLLFALNMLVNTTDGDTFTMSEYREWLSHAGLPDAEMLDPEGLPCDIIVARKP